MSAHVGRIRLRIRCLVVALALASLVACDDAEDASGDTVISESSASTAASTTTHREAATTVGSPASSLPTPTTTITLEPGQQLLVRGDLGGMDSRTVGFLTYESDAGCIYLLFPDSDIRQVLVWPAGTTATYPPLRVVEPLGSVKQEGKYVILRGGGHPWPEWRYDDPALNAGITRCADRPTDEVFDVGDDRL